MRQLRSIDDYSIVKNKKVFLRVDFNVPISGGRVTDSTKIEKLLKNINYLLSNDCKVILASHLGRPQQNGKTDLSLLPVKQITEKIFNQQISFLKINHTTKQKIDESKEKLVMLENLRFDPGEETNELEYAKLLSSFADI